MQVLIACEFSGIVREAFKARGHDAISVDLLPSEIPALPGHHFTGDIFNILSSLEGDDWNPDLLIGHPPCTYLCNSGVRWLYTQPDRWNKMIDASEFFYRLWNLPIDKICLENPISHKHAMLPDYTQIIQPWEHGHGETKATCLWLKGLPKLEASNIVSGREGRIHKMPPSKNRGKERSRTFQGIAEAMAEQWG